MKKLFALLLTAAMIMAVLTGCGGKDPDPAPSNPPSDNTPANSEPAGVTANPDYPNNGTINAVVGWSAGGTTDLVARKIASLMSISLGCNNNCTNVTGASGSIAAAQVAAEGTDGETAWGGMISAINTWGVMGYNDMSWKDWYCFVSAQTDFVLVVAGDSQFNTYQEFVDYAAANPGKLSSGNPGLGSVGHLAAVTFCDAFGIETNHVPYSGGRAAAIGVMGGEIDYLFIAYGDVFDLIQSGDMKPLAIAGAGADKTVAKTDGTEVVIPCLDAEKPQIAETTSKLGMWGVALPRSVAPEQVLAFQQGWLGAIQSSEFQGFCEETGIKAACIYGEEADKTMAEGQAVYVELLEGLNLTTVSGADLGIPTPADYSWDAVDMAGVNAWPAA
ncbi:MAG: hypothetical protein HFG10_08870 [Oscillibacter sp.]|jgi:tripartite-type tricarboxylate transporter receptor subunit TctC|nr:hypothetical protein [Oscillibacter sp.]